MRLHFIFNPNSGRNRARPGMDRWIRDFIAERSLDAGLSVTEGPGHARELARAAAVTGAETVVAVGGDGTMNEVAHGLLGSDTALALVPCGSGNGLALHLGIPRAARAALELAAGGRGRVAALDSGEADGHPFFNAMGVGIDAEVSARFNRLTRRGLASYVRAALACWREHRPLRCVVETAGRRHSFEALLVAVANSDQYGNHARIAPGARTDDGRLDLVVVRGAGLLRTGALVPRLFLGTLDRSPLVWRATGGEFIIERAEAGPLHTDGETREAGRSIRVAVRRRSLRMVVPALCGAVEPIEESAPRGFALLLP
jgi:YegS/Rv2252/BmrU family lipid kinase